MLEQLKQAYIEELKIRFATDPAFSYVASKATPEEAADRMFTAIERNAKAGGRNAWIPYNASLKQACKKVGITKDADLRALFIN